MHVVAPHLSLRLHNGCLCRLTSCHLASQKPHASSHTMKLTGSCSLRPPPPRRRLPANSLPATRDASTLLASSDRAYTRTLPPRLLRRSLSAGDPTTCHHLSSACSSPPSGGSIHGSHIYLLDASRARVCLCTTAASLLLSLPQALGLRMIGPC